MSIIDFQQLLNLGISKEKIKELANYLLGQINQDLYFKIKNSISQKDYEEMENKFDKVKTDQERVTILEEYYQKATGENFIESGYKLLQLYFNLIATVLAEVKGELEKIDQATPSIKESLILALQKDNYEEIKKILDSIK
ncbi:hypothetical protein HY345_01650 [Candidatus Microgenomates bacterium]|nr:hypothetical protein [Candidatus Microgenomates bacterium]